MYLEQIGVLVLAFACISRQFLCSGHNMFLHGIEVNTNYFLVYLSVDRHLVSFMFAQSFPFLRGCLIASNFYLNPLLFDK